MKNITITLEVDGNSLTRNYSIEESAFEEDWDMRVADMLDTLEKSNEKKF